MKKLFFALLSFLFLLQVKPVFASNDVEVTCDGNGSCIVSPDLPIFDDYAIYPGQKITSKVTVHNTSSYDGSFDFRIDNLTKSILNPVMTLTVSTDSAGNNLVYGPAIFDNLHDAYIVLDSFSAGQSKTYYYHAIFDLDAGNDYQNLETNFDLTLGFEFVKTTPLAVTTSSTTTTSRSVANVDAPRCDNENLFPSGPTNFQIISQTNNSMTLSWDSVAGASGYAIFFTRADGESYSVLPSLIPDGATQFTINNLAAANYTVQIVAVGGNDDLCSSPRTTATVAITGGVVTGRPLTEVGDVLGEQTDTEQKKEESLEKVLGVSDTCQAEQQSLPLILLAVQLVLALIIFVIFRKKPTYIKHIIIFAMTGIIITIFYWLRNCDCWQASWWTTLMCQWFFIVSLALSLILEPINYYLIEE